MDLERFVCTGRNKKDRPFAMIVAVLFSLRSHFQTLLDKVRLPALLASFYTSTELHGTVALASEPRALEVCVSPELLRFT